MSLSGCQTPGKTVDLLIKDATVYTVDENFSTCTSFVVKDGRIVDTGSADEMEKRYSAITTLSLAGKFVYPGWIDAHCHFFGYGLNLNAVDVAGTSSVDEIISLLKKHQETNSGSWITGRGWDQNDWEVKEFPDRTLLLDLHFPDTPVLLRRIDGHAAWVNTKALELSGVTAASKVEGGTVVLKDGQPSRGSLSTMPSDLSPQKSLNLLCRRCSRSPVRGPAELFPGGSYLRPGCRAPPVRCTTDRRPASKGCPEDPHQCNALSFRGKLYTLCGEGSLPNRPFVGKYNQTVHRRSAGIPGSADDQ